MKILIADKFSEAALSELKSSGLKITYNPELKDQTLLEAIKKDSPDVLVVRSTKVTKEMLEQGESLSLVVRAGAGVNTIDVETASKLGIFVTNCPGKNAVAVAELVFGLILSLDRNIPDNVVSLRQGKWNKKVFSGASGIKGQTLGLLGFGNIGKEVAKRARAFGMPVLCWSRSLTEEVADEFDLLKVNTPLEVAKKSDIVSVHLAATRETLNFCDTAFFEAMKPGAFFINTARGDIVDEKALLKAIEKKGLRVGADVFGNEPTAAEGDWSSDLSLHPKVYGTHHIGASTAQAETAIGKEAIKIIKTFALTGEVLNCVNVDMHSPATHVMTVRHLNRVGVLASVLNEIQKREINVFEMENSIFNGDEAACAKIRLSNAPNEETLKAIKSAHQAIISVTVSQITK